MDGVGVEIVPSGLIIFIYTMSVHKSKCGPRVKVKQRGEGLEVHVVLGDKTKLSRTSDLNCSGFISSLKCSGADDW